MKRLSFYLYFLILILLGSCAKEKDFPTARQYPLVKTISVSADSVSVTAKGEILLLGEKEISEYGFIYTPTAKNFTKGFKKVITAPLKTGPYSIKFSDYILKDVDYELQAYAITDDYTIYGNKIAFKGGGTSTPVVSNFEPKQGFDGTLITITGENFSEEKGLVKVKVGDSDAPVVKVTPTSIVVKSPAVDYIGSFPISVSVYDKQVTTTQKYTILGPHITHISKSTAKPGDEITLYGEYLTQQPMPGWNIGVTINGTKALIKSRTDKEIVISVPVIPEFLYNRPLAISVSGWNKRILLGSVLTIEPPNDAQGFRSASVAPTNLGTLYARMPSFVNISEACLFTLNHFVKYYMENDYWSRSSSFTGEGRSNSIVALVGNNAYVIGGRSSSKSFNEVWEYHYPTDTWSRKSNLPFTVYGATSFVLNDMIYFFGGNNSSNSNTLWKYDPQTGNVVALNNFPAVTAETGSTFTIDNKVYVVTSGSLYQYNTQQDMWSRVGNAPVNSFAFTVENQGYVVSANTKMLSRYDVAENSWVDISSYPSCITNAAFTGFGYKDRLYLASFSCSMNLYYHKLY